MRFNIISESERRIPRKKIMTLLNLIDEEEEPPQSTVNLVFIKDKRIHQLNKAYRGKDCPTDVLSFNIDDDEDEGAVFGEIYISTDTASKNAGKFGRTFTDEILLLCCHGFLHLLGYDHEADSDYKKMHAREEHFLGKLKR